VLQDLTGKKAPCVLILSVCTENTPYLETIEPYQLRLIAAAIRLRNWRSVLVDYHPQRFDRMMATIQPDVIFNLAYGFRDRNAGVNEDQADIAQRLESMGYIFVGSDSRSQRLAQDKLATAHRLQATGIRCPELMDADRWPPDIEYAVLKPRFGAFHRDVRLLHRRDRAQARNAQQNQMILQEYIDGPEYTVGLLEIPGADSIQVLPSIRIMFKDSQESPGIMTWEDPRWYFKFQEADSVDLGALAKHAFITLGLRDYARFDFRIGPDGPVLLEANSLPGLHPVYGLFPQAAAAAGIDYHVLVWRLVDLAFVRRNANRA
jgi:D-alanine-D-alanine ligase